MEYISIGNTIGLEWSVEYYGGAPFPLEDSAVRIFMVTSRGRSEVKEFTTSGNTVSWTFDTTDQYAGSYSFIMVLSDGDALKSRLVWDHALRLSSFNSTSSTGELVLSHTSRLDALATVINQYNMLNKDYVDEAIHTLGSLEERVTALENTDFEGQPTSDDTDYPEITLSE